MAIWLADGPGLFDAAGVAGHKLLPGAGTGGGHGALRLVEMAEGGGEGVGGVEFGEESLARDVEDAPQQLLHLLLGGGAVAGDGHFDLSGLVFGDGQAAGEGGGHGHPLCASEFEH